MNFRSRTYKSKGEYRFTQIDNEALDDSRLSNAAAGLLARLLRRPDDWRVMIEQIASCSPDGVHATRSAMRELIEFGYARQINRIDRVTRRFAGGDYVIFESSKLGLSFQEIEGVAEKHHSSAYQITACGFSACGESHTTKDCSESKTEGRKSPCPSGHGHGEAVAIAEPMPVCASLASAIHQCATVDGDGNDQSSATSTTGEPPEEYYDEIREEYARILAEDEARAASASPAPTSHETKGEGEKTAPRAKDGAAEPVQPTLKLNAEDEKSTGKKLPWGQIYHVFKRILPEIRMPSGGERRDRAMRRLWLANGKTITPFEQLASKVAASDFLMARGTFSGPDDGPWRTGKPVTWGWIFDYDDQGRCRYERIMEGAYDNERMEKIRRESNERKAKPNLVPVMDVMNKKHLIDWNEMHNGKPRWEKQGIHRSGLPLVIDWAEYS